MRAMVDYGIELLDMFQARRRIHHLTRMTPLLPCKELSERSGSNVHLKLDNLQATGSFKARGAANTLLSLSPEQKKRGVIAFSTGNHGRAVAHVASVLGIKAIVCLSRRVPQYRVQALEELGAEVERYGQSQDEALERALELERQGMVMVSPFDDPRVIAGQGTLALELMQDMPELDTVLVPLSGGGLMAGIALALKTISPEIRTIGVSLEVSAPMHESIRAGCPVEVDECDSIGDALLGGIGLANNYTFPICRDLVDDIVLVSEEEIAEGMFFAFDKHGQAIEGASAVGISSILSGKADKLGRNTAVIVSGGNVDTRMLHGICGRFYEAGNEHT